MSAEANLIEKGIQLPPAVKKGGVYKLVVQTGNLAYLSGHGPWQDDETFMTGRVGEEYDLEGAQNAARQTALALVSTLKNHYGSLDRISRVVKMLALVNCTDDFKEQPQVINGASNLFAEVFGEEAGIGARSALGTNTLPGNIPVEIELIVEIKD